MRKKFNRIFIPLLFISSFFAFCEVRVFSCSNNASDSEIVLSDHPGETFQHNHFEIPETSHEDFYRPTAPLVIYKIQVYSKKTEEYIITLPLKFTSNIWHPPKFI